MFTAERFENGINCAKLDRPPKWFKDWVPYQRAETEEDKLALWATWCKHAKTYHETGAVKHWREK